MRYGVDSDEMYWMLMDVSGCQWMPINVTMLQFVTHQLPVLWFVATNYGGDQVASGFLFSGQVQEVVADQCH